MGNQAHPNMTGASTSNGRAKNSKLPRVGELFEPAINVK